MYVKDSLKKSNARIKEGMSSELGSLKELKLPPEKAELSAAYSEEILEDAVEDFVLAAKAISTLLKVREKTIEKTIIFLLVMPPKKIRQP